MKTAIVILNWNGKDFLERFLPGLVMSVREAEGAEVIVADNGSTDGSLETGDVCPSIPQAAPAIRQ